MAGKSRLDLEKIKHLHAKNMHPTEIAKELGCSPSAIVERLHALELTWARKTPTKITPQDIESIIKEYKRGRGATSIGKDFHISKRAVYYVLNKAGVGTRSVLSRRRPRQMPKNPRTTPLDIQVKELHDNGLTPSQIAKQLNKYETNIRYSLCKQGLYQIGEPEVKVRQVVKVRSLGVGKGNARIPKDAGLRHDAFESFTEESCYWVGFLCADGCIYSKSAYGQARVFLNLKESDEPHLLKLKTFLNTNNTLVPLSHDAFGSIDKPYRSKQLSWTSNRHSALLQELGVVLHKEGRFVPISLQYNIPYWRGLIDGDGSVYHPKKGTVYLSGQPPIIKAWTDFCERLLGKDCMRIETRPSLQIGTIRHKAKARILLKHLYEGATVYLERKYQTASLWF